jgi:SH3 domain-containing YSC84-like protein 1
MRKISVLLLAAMCLVLIAACHRTQTTTTASGKVVTGDKAASIQRLRDAGQDLISLMNAPDASIPQEVLKDAKCVAVVPDMVKGGFLAVGGQHGRGVATCRLRSGGWSAPAFFTLTGGTWGPQIGLESVDLTMLIMNDKGMQDLLSSQFKLGGEAGVAAGPVGRQAEASTDWKMKSEVLTYSKARGVFAGLDLNGAVIKPDEDSTKAFYGRVIPFDTILNGRTQISADARPFVNDVRTAFKESQASSGQ